MKNILALLLILPSLCFGQTNNYEVGSSTSEFKATYTVPNDKLWSITTLDEGCKIITQSYVIASMGKKSVIMVPNDKKSGSLLMNLPIVLSPGSSYEFWCEKGKFVIIAEYDK